MNDIMTKAKVSMIVDHPFYATLALSMEFIEDRNILTACTNGKWIKYNPDYIGKLKKEEVIGVIVHEVMHVANLHHLRLGNRNHKKFNIAADYSMNDLILKSGIKLPPDTLFSHKFNNMSSEQIYDLLPDDIDAKSIGDVEPGEEQDKTEEERVKLLIAKAATVARQQGKLPANLDRFVSNTIKPKVNWREVLVRFLTERSISDYTWKKPNRRYLPTYLPSLDSVDVLGKIVLVVDTSASIDDKMLQMFAGEIADIMNYISMDLLVLYVDTVVSATQTFESGDDVKLRAQGGGGTDYRPAWEYMRTNDIDPTCTIYFTDGYCDSFPSEPAHPVLWVIYDNLNFKAPFGEIIEITKN